VFHLWLNIPVADIPTSPSVAVHPGSDKSGRSPLYGFLSRHGDKILALVPLAFLIWVVAQYAVAVPYLDQWELVPLLDKTYHGELTFHNLWAQHNEHRILFPKIIMLLLARLTRWNIHYELAVNVTLALGIFTVFIYQVTITGRKLGIAGLHWAIPAISLVVFSISQYQNWLWGWQLQMFLNLLAVTGGIVLLANDTFRWSKFAAAALLGIVATYSFADGALIWPIGLLLLLLVKTRAGERRAAAVGWILIGALTMGTYFYHYQKPEEHPPLGLIFKMPFEYAAYVFKYIGGICAQGLGGDVSSDGDFAFVFGLAGTVAAGWAGWTLFRKKIADPGTLLPYFGLSLYSVGSALITGVGRLGFGSDQALASRYCTMVTPLWVSLVVWLVLLRNRRPSAADTGPAPGPRRKPVPDPCQTVATWMLLAVLVMLTLGTVFGTDGAKALSREQTFGRNCLLNVAANPASETDYQGLRAIYPRPKVVVERYPILIKHRLSLFQDAQTSSVSQ
jgi:hypothetical protein